MLPRADAEGAVEPLRLTASWLSFCSGIMAAWGLDCWMACVDALEGHPSVDCGLAESLRCMALQYLVLAWPANAGILSLQS